MTTPMPVKSATTCLWVFDPDDGSHDTSCDNKFLLSTEEPLKAHKMTYCCFCGRVIKEVR